MKKKIYTYGGAALALILLILALKIIEMPRAPQGEYEPRIRPTDRLVTPNPKLRYISPKQFKDTVRHNVAMYVVADTPPIPLTTSHTQDRPYPLIHLYPSTFKQQFPKYEKQLREASVIIVGTDPALTGAHLNSTVTSVANLLCEQHIVNVWVFNPRMKDEPDPQNPQQTEPTRTLHSSEGTPSSLEPFRPE